MAPDSVSRRQFLRQGTGAAGAAWLRAVLPGLAAISQAACTAREDKAAFTILGDDEAAEFEAIAERIIPATDTPGARDAGVIYFIDQSFGTFNAPMLPMLREGLAGLQGGIEDGRTFSALSDDEQDALLRQNEDTPFFQLMRLITVEGYLMKPARFEEGRKQPQPRQCPAVAVLLGTHGRFDDQGAAVPTGTVDFVMITV